MGIAAAALAVEYGIPTFAIKGEDDSTYYRHIESVLATHPELKLVRPYEGR